MTTYNGEHFLKAQLDSIAQQKCLPLELVVCDDGSTDNTIRILQDFKSRMPFPVRIVQNEGRMGFKRNFMKSASLCIGDIVAFCDQDDIWEKEKLCVLQETFSGQNHLSITHDFSLIFDDGSPSIIPSYFERLKQGGFSRSINIKGCSLAYRRELIEAIGWPPPQSEWSHDSWIAVTSAVFGKRAFVDKPLIRHRIHGSNASGWVAKRSLTRRLLRDMYTIVFRSPKDMDDLINICVGRDNIADLVKVMEAKPFELEERQRAFIISRLQRRERIASFRGGAIYQHRIPRMFEAIKLLLLSCYTVGGGIFGFFADVLGRKSPKRARL